MRIGLFYQIQVPKPWTASSESQRIYEALEQIPFAEQQGFESVWFSEHHFRPVWSHNSAPDLTLAAVSQRTSRIRLGIGVVLAPIHHPLHVAARMATLDILSHGRVDVGLGRTGDTNAGIPEPSTIRPLRINRSYVIGLVSSLAMFESVCVFLSVAWPDCGAYPGRGAAACSSRRRSDPTSRTWSQCRSRRSGRVPAGLILRRVDGIRCAAAAEGVGVDFSPIRLPLVQLARCL